MIRVKEDIYSKKQRCLLRTEEHFYERLTIEEEVNVIKKLVDPIEEQLTEIMDLTAVAVLKRESLDFIRIYTISQINIINEE